MFWYLVIEKIYMPVSVDSFAGTTVTVLSNDGHDLQVTLATVSLWIHTGPGTDNITLKK